MPKLSLFFFFVFVTFSRVERERKRHMRSVFYGGFTKKKKENGNSFLKTSVPFVFHDCSSSDYFPFFFS